MEKNATLTDLRMELWLRLRNSGHIVWTTKSGKQVSINEMSNSHLLNTINMLERAYEEDDLIGDMDPLEWYD